LLKKHHLYFILGLVSLQAFAGPKEQAWKLHNRLTGVPPIKTATSDPLADMTKYIEAGDGEGAVKVAMANKNFYNVVIKNWVKPWTNREQTSRTDLNDFTATVIGMIKDDIPFNQVLSGDIIYTVNGVAAAYSNTNNDHYRQAETQNIDLAAQLMQQTQSMITGMPAAAVSGVLTTRAAGEAFYSAGTNRRVNRFTFMNFLCHDYEALHDINLPQDRVRRDVERNPGGDSRTFLNKCVGCHAGQDGLGGAYAYYDFVGGRLVYTPGVVVTKMNHNIYYRDGFVTTNDSWVNYWSTGQNQGKLQFAGAGPLRGNGVKQLGQMLTASKGFSQCMAKKVFQLVCLKDPVNTADVTMMKQLADGFEQSNYNMKDLIVNTSIGCVLNEDE
jgi:hypothetical protein